MKSSLSFPLWLTRVLQVFLVGWVFILVDCSNPPDLEFEPPLSRVQDMNEILHGIEIGDPYRWLEDQDSAETRTWIDAQNKYTDSLLHARSGRRELREMVGQFLEIDTIDVPRERGGRYFFGRRKANQNLSVLYFREGYDGADQVLIEDNAAPLKDPEGSLVGLVVVFRRALDEDSKDFSPDLDTDDPIRNIVEGIADPLFAVDKNWDITFVNQRAVEIFDELDVDIEDRDVIDGSYYINVVPDKGFFSKLLSTVSHTQTYQLVVKQLDESRSQVIFVDLSEENEQETIDYSFDFFNELATKF